MAQQWFLDLDGVRSGPYQTPEVLGLVAEGEVLPHHRISSSLKDQPWTTILEWRLEQAKLSGPSGEKKSYIPESKPTPPASTEPKRNPHEIPWNDPKDKSPPPAPPASNEVGAVDLNPDASPDEIEEVLQVLNTPEKTAPPILERVTAPPVLEPAPKPPEAPAALKTEVQESPAGSVVEYANPPVQDKPKRKRDPMAEMYDMLQNTKQKREAKEKATHHPSPAAEKQTKPAPKPLGSNSAFRTVVIGLLIMIPGFLLGQLFQQTAAPPNQPAVSEKNLTPPAKEPTEPKYEVVDRSTDKITIKGKVEKQILNNGAAPKPSAQPQTKAGAPTHGMSEKEVQELNEMKKELQELKALKEEMKNSNNRDNNMNTGGSDAQFDEDYLNAPDADRGDEGGGAAYDTTDYDAPQGKYPNPYKPIQNPNQPPVNY